MSETFLAINVTVIQLSLNVLLVMDCVTARCGSQVQPTKNDPCSPTSPQ